MADWKKTSLSFDLLNPIRVPIKSTLVALETLESILEALLAIVKAFFQDIGNPLKSIISLLLAAVRTIINQIKSSGFSILLVHPDFTRQDMSSVLQSVSGPYSTFESKVVTKFFDQSDVFRPQFTSGSAVAMIVFYLESNNPSTFLSQLYALLKFIKHPTFKEGMAAPVEVKVNPILNSGDVVSTFRGLFDGDIKDGTLAVEWRMPTTNTGSQSSSFVNSLVSLYNTFSIPNFIVERSETPIGDVVELNLNTPTIGSINDSTIKKYGLSNPTNTTFLVEENKNVYRDFAKKRIVSGSDLLQGAFTGIYRFIDGDGLTPGQVYYYRIRAYFGDVAGYVATKSANDFKGSNKEGSSALVRTDGNTKILRFPNNSSVSGASTIVRGFVPRKRAGSNDFNPYDTIYRAIQAAILLNFELTQPATQVTAFRQKQRTGWGSLASIGGQVSPLKIAFNTSEKLKNNVVFKTIARRLTNNCLNNIYSQPQLMNRLHNLWSGGNKDDASNGGVAGTVRKILETSIVWYLIGTKGGIKSNTEDRIDKYLSAEDGYVNGKPLKGPLPINPYKINNETFFVSEDSRRDLQEFLQAALSLTNGPTSYLSWYSVTIADLFPSFIPFIFDFEQFMLALLKSVDTALKNLDSIVSTILQKIKALEQVIKSIDVLISLLGVEAKGISVLATSNLNGSAQSLASSLIESTNKPPDLNDGLHSGMVMVFGGPGEGSLAAFNAIKFILTVGKG